ncbi:MAG TPA: endonuclease/exonuclease/phosphatase family protein [Luteitalea sp.]|nr:endonuclease/exonuclease/phosphatase family protein [Luteitalea sp.]
MTHPGQPRVQTPRRLRLATYNIHKCRGMDGRTRVDRIADVLASLDADVIALQEVVGSGPDEDGQAAELGARLGMGWVMDSVRLLRGKSYGNVVLSRLPIAETHRCDLSCDKREPRACHRIDVDVQGDILHVFNVHLGTAVGERRQQAPRLAEFVADKHVKGPKVLLGDFNEWVKGLASKTLSEMLEGIDLTQHLRRRRTYPGVLPILHLDHIYVAGGLVVEKVSLPRNRLTLVASDHLPLVADVRMPE